MPFEVRPTSHEQLSSRFFTASHAGSAPTGIDVQSPSLHARGRPRFSDLFRSFRPSKLKALVAQNRPSNTKLMNAQAYIKHELFQLRQMIDSVLHPYTGTTRRHFAPGEQTGFDYHVHAYTCFQKDSHKYGRYAASWAQQVRSHEDARAYALQQAAKNPASASFWHRKAMEHGEEVKRGQSQVRTCERDAARAMAQMQAHEHAYALEQLAADPENGEHWAAEARKYAESYAHYEEEAKKHDYAASNLQYGYVQQQQHEDAEVPRPYEPASSPSDARLAR